MDIEIIKSKIDRVFKDCSYEKWDGYRAVPVPLSVCEKAKDFASLILWTNSIFNKDILDLNNMSVSAEPDGSLVFEWYKSLENIISISVSPDKYIYWVECRDGNSKCGKFLWD